MEYDFDEIIDRRNTSSLKYDFAKERGMPEGLLPLWVADMDFRAPPEALSAMREKLEHGVFGYSVADAAYYEALAGWFMRGFGYRVEREWVVTSPGVVFAAVAAIRAFTSEGEGVLIQRPVYYPFSQMIRANGRVVVNSPLVESDGRYSIDFDDLERKIADNRVRLFILCSPHNPVGRVWTRGELERLGEICLKHSCIVLSDEVHCDFVYPGHRHTPLASISPEFAENTLTCTAPSKTFNLPGLQVSNTIIQNAALRAKFARAARSTGFEEMNIFGLVACQSAYAHGEGWLDALLAYLAGNLGLLRSFLSESLPKARLVEPEGTYLAWMDFRGFGLSPEELDRMMVERAGLWLDGGTIFGEEGAGFQRINIACPRAALRQALERLAAAFAEA
ncbi:MAG: pyridoxal phosphate-dependent aminotransferase [Clostridiales Family XIII bacterium]|jgi:cystathionine beta-lyase|nr:pyridoxal phosphate-dependent aminotransferase [Clostridiales Family XIII bacterium]